MPLTCTQKQVQKNSVSETESNMEEEDLEEELVRVQKKNNDSIDSIEKEIELLDRNMFAFDEYLEDDL